MTLLFACLQVAGAASDAADRALARGLLVGLNLPLRRSFPADATENGNGLGYVAPRRGRRPRLAEA